MRILALDSSGLVATVAIVEDDQTIAEYTVNYKKTHSQTLLPRLDEIVKMTELICLQLMQLQLRVGQVRLLDFELARQQQKGLDLLLINH